MIGETFTPTAKIKMKEILLTQGQVALIDDEDFETVSQFKWCATLCASRTLVAYYALRRQVSNYHRTTILMHRMLLDAPAGMQVDHINGNGLDNRKSNLRVCTGPQNSWNARLSSINNVRLQGRDMRQEDGSFRGSHPVPDEAIPFRTIRHGRRGGNGLRRKG